MSKLNYYIVIINLFNSRYELVYIDFIYLFHMCFHVTKFLNILKTISLYFFYFNVISDNLFLIL